VRGLVSEYRYGLVEEGKSRIVIDTLGPVLIERSFLVEPQLGQPARKGPDPCHDLVRCEPLRAGCVSSGWRRNRKVLDHGPH